MNLITFHGAAKQVTGSCFLLETAGLRILVDCGMFQGSRDLDEDNADEFGFDPASIDVLLLTHAHLDHCGRIPLLVKRGFAGEIISTAATRELARLVMTDAANLQEDSVRWRHRRRRRSDGDGSEPLYTLIDAFRAMDCFGRIAHYDVPLPLSPEVVVRFMDAGHILGSASVLVETGTGKAHRRILFSGDIGNAGRPLLRPPQIPTQADCVVMETTYGDRDHRSMQDSVGELQQAIASTLQAGGNVVIPAFALERAQELLWCIADAVGQGLLPAHLPVFLDSPMAIDATDIFRRHPECLNDATRARVGRGVLVDLPGLRFVRDSSESMAINSIESGAVIIAGSGMCTGGRVRHHLKHNLWRERASVVFVGYAAGGTPARAIIDGAQTVRLFGEDVRVRAKIWTINGFSAHAGQTDLLAWLDHVGQPRDLLLVHGDVDRGMSAFADKLSERGLNCHIPGAHERVKLH